MPSFAESPCHNLELAGYNAQVAAEEVWEAILSAGAFIELTEPTHFASGVTATLKVNAEVLDKKPRQRAIVLGHVASFPCIREADVLLYVPEGMRNFVNVLGWEMGILVAQARRNPKGTSRYDFCFIDPEDENLALSAERPRIVEDVVTTLGSVAGMVRLLRNGEQDIHSLALLLRGAVDPQYQAGLTDHYLVERRIPLDKEELPVHFESWELELIKAVRQQAKPARQ